MGVRWMWLGAVPAVCWLTAGTASGQAGPASSCAAHLAPFDHAVAAHDAAAARTAWCAAHLAALRARRWDCLVAVGDAALRLDHRAWPDRPAVEWARELYLAALMRARAERSLTGVLRVAEAFAGLGDHATVEACLRIAEQIDPRNRARIDAVRARLSASSAP